MYPLFKHQIKASQECLDILKSKKPRVFLHMPTGSGKTRTAINVMCSLIREKTEKFVIVWLANKEELCDQAFEEFFRAWQILGNHTNLSILLTLVLTGPTQPNRWLEKLFHSSTLLC